MNINALTAAKIREVRKELGYTVDAMAKDLGISKTAYSQLENGHVEITLNRIDAIAQICHISLAELIPYTKGNHQISNGSGNNMNGNIEGNTINNNFFDPEQKLQFIADNLNAAIREMKKAKEKK